MQQTQFLRNQDADLPLLFLSLLSQDHKLSYPLLAQSSMTHPGTTEVFHSSSQKMGNATVVKFQEACSNFNCDLEVLKSDTTVNAQSVPDWSFH